MDGNSFGRDLGRVMTVYAVGLLALGMALGAGLFWVCTH